MGSDDEMSLSSYSKSDSEDDYTPDDEDSYSSSEEESDPKPKKKKSGKKALDDGKKVTVKAVGKQKIKDDLTFNPKTFVPVAQDLTPFAVLTAADYTVFNDPADAPTGGGYRGCAQVTITLGPLQDFSNSGTNSSGAFPLAKADAQVTYYQQTFISGHVLNADFGGPDAPKNMTILTSSANSQQKTFDSNVKKARNTIYSIYMDLAALGPKSTNFLAALGYGIELDLQVGQTGGRWHHKYPGNCISNRIDLDAQIVGEVKVLTAIGNPNTYFSSPRPSILIGIQGKLTTVQNYIATAMTGSRLDNSEY
jgi:hypothetical protein